jgi:hypothetical protein
MFRKRNTVINTNRELIQNIELDIRNKLNEKGVIISGINTEMKPKNLSLSIQITCLPPKAQQLL